MKVWLVDHDDNDCDNRSNLVVTEAVCDSDTRAAQFIFDVTGAWPEKADDGTLSLRDRNGHDWSAYEYEVLCLGIQPPMLTDQQVSALRKEWYDRHAHQA